MPARAGVALPGRAAGVSFAHESEEGFARILDFYGIRWQYEPRTFVLRAEGDEVREAFTPDFYLPDADLYVELTTRKQSLVTDKNRKVRRLRELYPGLQVRLLYKRDYVRLLARFGLGVSPAVGGESLGDVLYTQDEISQRVAKLARQVSRDYRGKRPVLVGILKGVVPFMSDLMRAIRLPTQVDFLSISRYRQDGSKRVRVVRDLEINLAGRDVLLVEDIVDTGLTLSYVLRYLRRKGPATLEVCALLDKRARRLVDSPLRYIGFEVPDTFVVGYGLDFQQEFRNLPFIAALSPPLESPP